MSVSGNLIGLDVGQSHLTAVRLAGDGDGSLTPLQILEMGIPRGTFDAQGRVVRGEIIADAVKHLRTVKGLKGKKAVISLPGPLLTIQPLSKPNQLNGQDLESSVRLELEPGLPYEREQALISTKELSRDDSEGGMVKILTVAINRDSPVPLIESIKRGGLQVVDVLPAPIVLPRAMQSLPGIEVLLDIGMMSSTVVSMQQGQVDYAHTIPLGSDHFTQALIQSGMQNDEAERWKRTHSLVAPKGKEDPFPRQRQALTAAADDLVEAVYQVMTYDNSENAESGINRLLLSGGGSNLSGLKGYLGSSLGLPVESAEPHPVLHGIDPGKFSRQALALALAMSDDSDIKR